MKRLFGNILIIIGSVALIITSLVKTIFFILSLINKDLNFLGSSSDIFVWLTFVLYILLIIYGLIYNFYTLRLISLGRSSKRALFVSLPFFILNIILFTLMYVIFKENEDILFKTITLFIIDVVFYLIQFLGTLNNYKKQY